MKIIRIFIVLFILVFAFGLAAQSVSADIIKTGPSELGIFEESTSSSIPSLAVFARSVKTGLPNQVSGVYVQGVLAFPVVQQPKSEAGYVSNLPDTITQFRMAGPYHTIGLLAHDYLAGSTFDKLPPGSEIILVFGDGRLKNYRVYEVQQYQALSPTDPYSNFVDISDLTNLSADQLFFHTYGLGNDTLVLQTCISTPSVPSWGRIFVLARPVESSRPTASFWDTFPIFKQALAGTAGQ
jgi:hypothetical protein